MERRAAGSEIRNQVAALHVAAELLALGQGVDAGHGGDEVVPVGLAGLRHGAGLGGGAGHDRGTQVRLPMKKQIWQNWKK